MRDFTATSSDFSEIQSFKLLPLITTSLASLLPLPLSLCNSYALFWSALKKHCMQLGNRRFLALGGLWFLWHKKLLHGTQLASFDRKKKLQVSGKRAGSEPYEYFHTSLDPVVYLNPKSNFWSASTLEEK